MNEPQRDETMQARMKGIRGDIDQGLVDVSAGARSMVDWKHYVKTYPWVCMGTVAALGFLVVPKRSTATAADVVPPAELPKTAQRDADSPPSADSPPFAVRGVADMLVAAAVSFAVRETAGYVGQAVAGWLGATKPLRPNDQASGNQRS